VFPPIFRRRSRSSALIEASRVGVERIREALPEAGLADIFVDLASRSGVDLGAVAERVFERLRDAISRAEAEASDLADTDTAQQLRDMAARAAGHAAELAYRTGAERLVEAAVPRRHSRSNRGLILLGAGLVAGGVVAYMALSRSGQSRSRPAGQPAPQPDETAGGVTPPGTAITQGDQQAVVSTPSPIQQAVEGFRARLRAATRAARAQRSETERRLWWEYRNSSATLFEPPARDPTPRPTSEFI
jgi:hypothetical protein